MPRTPLPVGPAREAVRAADLGRTTDTPRGPATPADAPAFPVADDTTRPVARLGRETR